MSDSTPRSLATRYFDAWKGKDYDALQSLLADDVTFAGPLGRASGPAECRQGVEGLSRITTDVVIRAMLADDTDVMTWFDLHTTETAEPLQVVNWSHVENGRISRIRAAFDPRPLTG